MKLRTSSFTAMLSAVKVVDAHGPRSPDDIKAKLTIRFFELFRNLESIEDMLHPDPKREMDKALLKPEDEQKKYGKLTERQERMKTVDPDIKVIESEPDTEPPPDSSSLVPTPTQDLYNIQIRQDLYNMIKVLDKNYKLVNETLDNLQVQIKELKSKII